MTQDKAIKNHKATLKRKGLLFFIITLALLLAGVYVYAEPIMVSCVIPEVAGLNTPVIEGERVEAGGNQGQIPAQGEAGDVVERTLYSR